MIAREFFAGQAHAGLDSGSTPGEDGLADADQASDDMDSFDPGGFGEA
jgi:hypothetical protein